MSTFEIGRDKRAIKKPELLSDNVLKIFAPRKLKLRQAEYTEYNTGIVVN